MEKRSAQASAYPLSQAQGGIFCVLTGRVGCVCLRNTQGANVCSLYRSVKPFYSFFCRCSCCFLIFRHLKITLDSEQPMLKEKRIIPSV